jgi:hypothetical protein
LPHANRTRVQTELDIGAVCGSCCFVSSVRPKVPYLPLLLWGLLQAREDAAWAVGSLASNGRRAHVRFVVQSGAVEALCHLLVAAAREGEAGPASTSSTSQEGWRGTPGKAAEAAAEAAAAEAVSRVELLPPF